jgi:hypothetical protein
MHLPTSSGHLDCWRLLAVRKFLISASTFVIVLSCSTSLLAQQPHVVKITVESRWGGLGAVSHTEVLIAKDGNGYLRERDRLDGQLVGSLSIALNEPPVPTPELKNLGINQAWLDANAVPAVEKYAGSFDDAAPNQKTLYQESFTNETLVGQVIPSLFNFSRSDDFPSAKVEVTFEDGSTTTALSASQYLFMLPWKVMRNGEAITTYDANISRAVAALMPNEATNRSRIAGEALDVDLAEAVMHHIEKEWNLLDVENRVGGTLTTLRGTYTVESAEINAYHGVAYGVAWKGNQPHEENLHVVLRQESFPQSFFENAIFLYIDGNVSGTEDFLQNAGKYENLVFSVPWLNHLTAGYPGYRIELLWVHDRSFSEKAMKIFATDMDAVGKGALANEVRAEQDKIALITIDYDDYWLVLPDERMIFWRYSTVSGLLNFKASDFSVQRCAEYSSVTGGCVGAVILPDGTFAK